MLFPYKYVPHQMEKMQTFIDFIFYEVWCKAPNEEYGIHLYEAETDLLKVMEELYKRDMAGKLMDKSADNFFYVAINEIYNEFKTLTDHEIDQYKSCFTANNMVEELCSCVTAQRPITYVDLYPAREALNKKINNFFKQLYSSGFFDLKFVREALDSRLSDYYLSFVRENNNCTCPFCGLQPLDSEYDPSREAFDHYLPKSKYPFNSVNLKNLAPSCNKCNSGNKMDKDPLHDKQGNRRKAFYPFSEKQSDIAIKVVIKEKNWSTLTPENLSIDIQSVEFQDETETWKELFRSEQRDAAMCCNTNGGSYWLNRVINENQNYSLSMQEMLAAELKSASASPWIDANFLKKAFLKGCDSAGLFAIKEEVLETKNQKP